MARRTPDQQWDDIEDKATSAERRWIDAWASFWQRGGCKDSRKKYKVTGRHQDGTFRFLHVRIERHLKTVLRCGVMAMTLDQIKQEVRRYQAQERRERRREAEHQVGAYI